jgi:hypothetical protein
MAQALDSSSYMKKLLITNKVTSHFFITLSKPISCTLRALPTDLSRLNDGSLTAIRIEWEFYLLKSGVCGLY